MSSQPSIDTVSLKSNGSSVTTLVKATCGTTATTEYPQSFPIAPPLDRSGGVGPLDRTTTWSKSVGRKVSGFFSSSLRGKKNPKDEAQFDLEATSMASTSQGRARRLPVPSFGDEQQGQCGRKEAPPPLNLMEDIGTVRYVAKWLVLPALSY